MDDIVIFGLVLLGVGVMLILIGVFSKANKNSEEQEDELIDSGKIETDKDEEIPSIQRKYGPDDVLTKMQKDEKFRKEVYSIINKNKENQK